MATSTSSSQRTETQSTKDVNLKVNMVATVGLPLLIANGKFQNLASMSVENLENFIPFLTKCSIYRAGAQLINGIPEWWPSSIKYKFPLRKPNGLSKIGYHKYLATLVCRCYWYHNAQFLLPFSAEVALKPDSVYLQSNEDNTTSVFIYNGSIHVMKFHNENKNYDSPVGKGGKRHRRSLLLGLSKRTPPIADIYLCENCDAEFISQAEMKEHEKTCEVFNDKIDSFSDSSDEIEVLEHIRPGGISSSFFDYLQLHPKNCPTPVASHYSRNSKDSLRKLRIKADSYLIRYKNVEFSSLFGRKILNSCTKVNKNPTTHRSTNGSVELYCGQKTRNSREVRGDLVPADFRVTCKKTKGMNWVHEYCFNSTQKRKRYKTLITGLDEKSRKLLKMCKKAKVVLVRPEITALGNSSQARNKSKKFQGLLK